MVLASVMTLVVVQHGESYTIPLSRRAPEIFTRSASASTTTSLNSMGSDQIERPEDEDTPEFKEYLRTLLKMQANRAKSGL